VGRAPSCRRRLTPGALREQGRRAETAEFAEKSLTDDLAGTIGAPAPEIRRVCAHTPYELQQLDAAERHLRTRLTPAVSEDTASDFGITPRRPPSAVCHTPGAHQFAPGALTQRSGRPAATTTECLICGPVRDRSGHPMSAAHIADPL
jgi:hypothetical protein